MKHSKALSITWDDLRASVEKLEIALVFGWQDVAQRYRRSKIGAFWLSINMGVMIGALGLIFGTLFRMDMFEFLPFVATGMIIWGLISTTMSESCTGFSASEGVILQVKLPFFTHIFRLIWRNVVIMGHNMAIYPLVLLIFQKNPGFAILAAVPGLILLILNVTWVSMILATLCARYRDMTQIVVNLLQVFFYATPLMWTPQTLPEGPIQWVLVLNPFVHLIELVREPLLGNLPSVESWIACTVFAILGWTTTFIVFGKQKRNIPYWL